MLIIILLGLSIHESKALTMIPSHTRICVKDKLSFVSVTTTYPKLSQ